MCLTNIHHIAILITAVKVAKCNLNFVQEGQGRTILFNATQRIQVESLMTLVIAFVITVDWLRCEANCQTLLGGDDIVLSEKRRVVLSICKSWRVTCVRFSVFFVLVSLT